ncbi:MAG: pyridine nucleotide-disulfide oxidoreductase [Chloroflexi bacterium RBG_13_46_14]|nr:MAG: pyridine nucleotide-disulfide oxidoreductase [Chloroflexi bacterium RBG_13_46_14]
MGKKVVILGGGFGGITAAKAFKGTNFEVTLIDKTNHNLFLPVLYQVAAAAMSPGDIAIPIRQLLKKVKNCKVVLGEVTKIDVEKKQVHTDEHTFDYDYLIVSIGSRASYFGHDEWAEYAPGLKTLHDALTIREKMLASFEKAEMTEDSMEKSRLLTFVVVGGGPAGVEMAGALAEISKRMLKDDFRNIDHKATKVILVEALDKILPAFSLDMSRRAIRDLEKIGVEVRLNTMVTNIDGKGVHTKDDVIETQNIVWGAGVQGHAVIKTMNTETDRGGRVLVENDWSSKGHPEVFVIGDAAVFMSDGKPLPAVAPAATQPARYTANIIKKNIAKENREPFKYFDKGNLATIARYKAVLEVHGIKASGFIAWVIWIVVHLAVLVGGRSRYKVLAEWIWHYAAKDNGVRIISNK